MAILTDSKCSYVLLRSRFLVLIFLFATTKLAAQQLLTEKEYKLPAKVNKITINAQGVWFVADSKNQIWAFDSLGQQIALYSPERLLTITQLIAKPGRQVEIFDKNNQSLTRLDRFLVERQVSMLADWFPNRYIEAIALADDNQWWMIDPGAMELIKVDAETGEILTKVSLYDIKTDKPLAVNQFWMAGNSLWLISNTELLQFDRLGNYIQNYKLPAASRYFTSQNRIFFIGQQDTIGWFSLTRQEVVQVVFPGASNYQIITGAGNYIYLLNEDKVLPMQMLKP